MWLLTSLLILWPCLGLAMEQPTTYSLLYSDVDACTRYNFLPINAKNFREAILFFNLCQQLIHLLPENQRKDYAKHLKHEVIMTKNEFKSKNNNKDIAQWLDARIDSLIQELNKLQPDVRDKSDFKLDSFWPILPIGKMNYFRKTDQAEDSTPRYTSRTITMQADEALRMDHTSRHQDYNEMDQDDDLMMAEEKININDIALIGLILGLVSTVSAAMTLLYICYCGAKRAKKKVISGNHQKGGTDDDKEKLINQRNSRAAIEAQVSTKIAKYASGECKLNRSDGRISEYQSFDANCPAQRDGEHDYENTHREESSMASGQLGKITYETETDYEPTNENLQWDSHNPEVSSIYLQSQIVNLPNMQAVNTSTEIQGPGYPRVGSRLSQSTIKDQSHLEYYAVPTNELGQRTKSKDGYRDSDGPKLIFNNFSQQKLNEHGRCGGMSTDMRELQKRSLLGDDKKTNPSFSYIQQKYSKGQVPLMNSHFPCDIQHTQRQQQQKSHLQQQQPPLQSIPDRQQAQQLSKLQQDPKMMSNSENIKTVVMNNGGKEPSLIYGSNTLRVGDSQEPRQLSQCKNCKKRIPSKKRQGLISENMSTLMRMKMEASKNDSGLDKTSAPHRIDSESIMQQEKFLCSMSATTPLTTKEQYFAPGDKTLQKKSGISEQIKDAGNNMVAKNMSHLAIGDPSSNVQKSLMDKNLIASSDLHLTSVDTQKIAEQKQYYMSLHTPAVKKYHRQKCGHPKSPLATARSAKKLTRKLPMQEINSSYYSVKPGSPYQSCAEVNPLQSSKQDPSAVSATENVFTPNIQQKDFQKALKTMFKKYSSNVKGADDDQEMMLKT